MDTWRTPPTGLLTRGIPGPASSQPHFLEFYLCWHCITFQVQPFAEGGQANAVPVALGHNSKAVHRAYARKAKVELPSLAEYERQQKQAGADRATQLTVQT
jgi:hypothetical protein